VWLFFTHSVAAADARRLGFYILTETMASGAAGFEPATFGFMKRAEWVLQGRRTRRISIPTRFATSLIRRASWLGDVALPRPLRRQT
jgi:hypothetical protein